MKNKQELVNKIIDFYLTGHNLKENEAKAIISLKDEYKKLTLTNVSQSNAQLMAILTSRVLTIQSEPDGIVRETMINNLLIDINCG